ncbi:hypothetical protein AB0H12_20795 [Actinosynnema sp. NPDC023794]
MTSARGAEFALTNPQNRVRAVLRPADAGTVTVRGDQIAVTAHRPALLTIVYQRRRADGGYRDVANTGPRGGVPVQLVIPVVVRR